MLRTEAELQKYFIRKLRAIGCLAYKFSSPSKTGVPDLIVIDTLGRTHYIEMKHPLGTGKLSKLQTLEIAKMRKQGAIVYVFSSVLECDNFCLTLECEASC